jgi:ribonuclease Y
MRCNSSKESASVFSIETIVTGVVSFLVGIAAVKFLDWYTKRGASIEAKRIIDQAEQQAKTKVREAELELKERTLREKAEVEKDLHAAREDLRERERLLDKRQETVEQQADDLRKQEKIVEGTQRRLTERLEDTNRRNEELAKLLDMQRQSLHETSGLSREEAEKRLLGMLDEELSQ